MTKVAANRRNCNFERLKVKLFSKIRMIRSDKRIQEVILSILERGSIDILLVHQMEITAPKVHWLDHPTASPRLLNEPEFIHGWAFANLYKDSMKKDTILHLTSYTSHLHICISIIPSGTASRPTKRGVAATLAFGHLTVVHIAHLPSPDSVKSKTLTVVIAMIDARLMHLSSFNLRVRLAALWLHMVVSWCLSEIQVTSVEPKSPLLLSLRVLG